MEKGFEMVVSDYRPAAVLHDEKWAAAFLGGISTKTLQSWRVKGIGPRWVKVGRLVRYMQTDLEQWIESQRRGSTSEN